MKKVVEITIPEDLKTEPILYESIKQFSVIINIIEASFSSDIGWALLSVEGDEEEVAKVLGFWREKTITVDIREEK